MSKLEDSQKRLEHALELMSLPNASQNQLEQACERLRVYDKKFSTSNCAIPSAHAKAIEDTRLKMKDRIEGMKRKGEVSAASSV